MTPRTVAWALGAVTVALAVALTVVLLHRPQPPIETAAGPSAPASPVPSFGSSPSTAAADPSEEGGPSDLPTSEVHDHSDASPGTTPYSQTGQARQQWQPIVTGFGRAFTTTKGKIARQWRKALTPYVTDTVREQLGTVDLRKVPNGRFTSIEPAEYGDDKVAVFLHYDTGLTLVAYLIVDQTSWRVYAYDRWED